jgi:hypothetical protein
MLQQKRLENHRAAFVMSVLLEVLFYLEEIRSRADLYLGVAI